MSSRYQITVAILMTLAAQALAVAAEDERGFHPAPVESVRVVLPADAAPVLKNIAALFARQVQQRCAATVATVGEAPLRVELAVQPGIGVEGFTIADVKPGVIRIAGNDLRGVLYGVGKFLHTSRYDQGGFTPGVWRGTSVPKKTVRGIYLATHFHNFYHDAPIEEVQHYVQELCLWGFNSIGVWYDMCETKTFDDPGAGAYRARLKAILQSARDVGMGAALFLVGNEADPTCPKEFRAAKTERVPYVPFYTCPSVPGGIDYTLKLMGKLFDWGADLRPEYVCIWPYDPGGCGCDKCRPWVTNGFLKGAQNIAKLAKEKFPGVKIVLSTWFFQRDEFEGLQEKWRVAAVWADFVLTGRCSVIGTETPDWIDAFGGSRGSPGGLPMVGFPDISMHGMEPWGGFGANPMPRYVNDEWNPRKNILAGGWPYSEGIYEDMNKVFYGQLYWSPDRPVAETVKEYAAFEFSPAVAPDMVKVVNILEENLGHEMRGEQCRNHINARAGEAFALVQQIDAKLTPAARRSWRWRILYLRAQIDKELFEKKGKVEGNVLRAALQELRNIYADNTHPALTPPQGK